MTRRHKITAVAAVGAVVVVVGGAVIVGLSARVSNAESRFAVALLFEVDGTGSRAPRTASGRSGIDTVAIHVQAG